MPNYESFFNFRFHYQYNLLYKYNGFNNNIKKFSFYLNDYFIDIFQIFFPISIFIYHFLTLSNTKMAKVLFNKCLLQLNSTKISHYYFAKGDSKC